MTRKQTFIIAEAGDNHNGNIDLALKLVDAAFEAKADAVKFQTFKTEEIICKNAKMAEYQKKNLGFEESQFDMVKKLELTFDEFARIKNYCDKKGIQFLSTAFDIPSAKFLNTLNIPIFKVPSGEITNLPLLREINSYKKDVILSTSMATLDGIQDALNILKDCNVSLLHCTTEYPCPYENVNMKAMLTMRDKFGLPVGYSDHTQGIEIPVMAVAMGATIIEKHFTLDKTMEGPDHKASLEPDELKQMVDEIRNVEKAFGNGVKEPQEAEKKNIEIARKSIVAKCDIKKGEIFSDANITTKRPGNGISPMMWDEIVGKKANKDYQEDELICEKLH